MKEKLYLFILIAIVLLFTSCQPTPKSPTVIKKDNFEGLVENTAQPTEETEQPQNQSESFKATKKHITWNECKSYEQDYIQGTKITKTTRINVEAEINTHFPKASVYLVEPVEYDIKFAQRAVEFFLGDVYYDDIYTKDDIMLKILPMQNALTNMKECENAVQSAKNLLLMWKGDYKDAPSNNTKGKVEFAKGRFNYIGLKGYPYKGAVAELYIANGGMQYTDFYYCVQDGEISYDDLWYTTEYKGTPARGMKKSYEESLKLAQVAIKTIYEKEMVHVQTNLLNGTKVDEDWAMYRSGKLDDVRGQCYEFYFTPVYNGIPQLFAPKAKNFDEPKDTGGGTYIERWDKEYSMKWPAEYVKVQVDDNGIIEFWGFAPAGVKEIVNENVQVLSFDKIFEIFKKNIFHSSIWMNGAINTVEINIDKIEFGMVRVPRKDNPSEYYMVPAWKFKGSNHDSFKRSKETWGELVKAGLVQGEQPVIEHNESGKTFLVLNALDGSIIDTSYFYDNEKQLEKTIGARKD